MRQIYKFRPIGRMNRRSLVSEIGDTQVLWRENFQVIGADAETRFLRKVSGSDRFNSTSTGTPPFVSGIRYYTKQNKRRTFAYNQDGYLYYFDENGNTTQLLGVFSPLAYPCFEIMRVSDTDILYFAEGVSTGMVSWLDRLWCFEEDSEDINFSKNLVPTNFTDSTDAGVITIGAKRGSKIQQIIVYKDILYIFKQDSIWRINGRTPNEFQVELVVDSFGLAARRSLIKKENGMFLLGTDFEVYTFSGTEESLQMITYDLALSGDFTKNLNAIINRDRMDQVCATFHNKTYRMAFTESGEVQNKMEYCFDTVSQTDYFTRGNNVSCYIQFDRFPDKLELFTGRSDIGRLMKQYTGLNWDSSDSVK